MDIIARALAANSWFFSPPVILITATGMLQTPYKADRAIEGVTHMLVDLKYASRRLLKSPSFAITAVFTLALGIGANAVVFSVLNGLVLHTLNVPDAQSFYSIEERDQSLNSYPDYLDIRDRNRSFDGVLAFNFAAAGLDTGGNPSQIWLYEASGNYFDTLGIKPYLGRFFQRSDEHGPNSSPYIVLSYDYWRSHFEADPGVIGRTVQLNKHPFTVLGVAGPEFRGTERFFAPALWVPMVDQEQIEGFNDQNLRTARSLWLIGRVKPGVTAVQANADMQSIAAFLTKTYPKDDDELTFSLARPGLLGNLLGRPVRAFVAGLMLLAGLILLAACANLGSLFAARAADRSREIALRLALGSSRRHILRQLLTEAVLVALVGGVAGIAASVVLLRGLSAWQPLSNIPINLPVRPDALTYVVSVLLALASGLLFGLVPVRQILKADPWQVVKTGSTTATGGRWFGTRDVLLVVQIALCAVLVTSSLVAVRGLVRSLHSDFGFQPQNALLVNTDLNMAGYHGDQVPVMQRRMLDAVANIPGVASVGLVDYLPLGLGWNENSIYANTTTDLRESNKVAEAETYDVSPGYFQAAGTTLLAGRTTSWNDDKKAPKVAVVNREFARKVFGSVAQAVGGYFKTTEGHRIEVVGVVEDGKYQTLTEDAATGVLPAHTAIAYHRHVVSGAVQWRSATSGGGPARHLTRARPGAAAHDHNLAKAAGQRAVCRAYGDGLPGCAGGAGRDAGGYRHLRYGLLLGEQAGAGNRHSRRPGSAPQGGIAGGAGKNVPAAGNRRSCRLAAGYGGHPAAVLHCLSGLAAGSGGARGSGCHHDSSRPAGGLRSGPACPGGGSSDSVA